MRKPTRRRNCSAGSRRGPPANPFHAADYLRARQVLGDQVCVVGLRDEPEPVALCPALLRVGRWSRTLEIESLPRVPEGTEFWDGLVRFCHGTHVTDLIVSTYGSPSLAIPSLSREKARRKRCEYVLDLKDADLWGRLSSNHKYNIKRARKAGLQLHTTDDPATCREHARLVVQSHERRQRGERLSDDVPMNEWAALPEAGAGRLFQALAGDRVLSSLLVLVAEKGAYFHSAGTGPEGMAVGASHFLFYEIARQLQEQSLEVSNLGGADATCPGLHRFKAGFGTTAVPLEAVECYLGHGLWKKARTAVRLLRCDPVAVLPAVARRERLLVYSTDPQRVIPPEVSGDRTLEKLSDQVLANLTGEFEEQAARFRRLGLNAAYGVFRRGDLVHVSWLIPAALDTRAVQYIKLRPGEAEITGCQTATVQRRQGHYTFAIRRLCAVAARQGVRRVFMGVAPENEASQRGIERAGLVRCGTVHRLAFPFVSATAGVALRTYH